MKKQQYMPIWIHILMYFIVVFAIVSFFWPFVMADKHPAFYIKDGEVWIVPDGKEEPARMLGATNTVVPSIQVTPNGKWAFYQHGGDLFKVRTSNPGEATKLLSNEIGHFVISEDGRKLICQKPSENYGNSDYFVCDFNGNKTFLAEGVQGVLKEYGDNKNFYYRAEGKLFYKKWGKEPVLLTEGYDEFGLLGKWVYWTEKNKGEYDGEAEYGLYFAKNGKVKKVAGNLTSPYLIHTDGDFTFYFVSTGERKEWWGVKAGQTPFLTYTDRDDMLNFQVQGDTLYALERCEQDKLANVKMASNGDLYKYKIGNGRLHSRKLIKENVMSYNTGEKLLYIYDAAGKGFEIYDGKKLKRVTENEYMAVLDNSKAELIFIDEVRWVPGDAGEGHEIIMGTLKSYKNGKSKVIAEDVMFAHYFGDRLFYIKKDGLYMKKGYKEVKIDSKAEQLLAPVTNKY
ncbi:MAG: hypothetical protein FWE47_03865 [Oscillospiraceae bacterium]|nr:hypothetical protein [Oscillospiraceae bacterium]